MKKALLEVISLSADVVTTSVGGGNTCGCNFGNVDPWADTAADDC